jgi:hypothetical protein
VRTRRTAPAATDETVHIISDSHYTKWLDAASWRVAKFEDDTQYGTGITPILRVNAGDIDNENDATNVNDPANDVLTKAWMDGLEPVAPWGGVTGNHDAYIANRTPAACMAALGLPGIRYAIDAGPARFLFVSPIAQVDNSEMRLDQAGLDWLDEQLGDTDRDCIIIFHAPLYNTVIEPALPGSAGLMWDSTVAEFFAVLEGTSSDAAIRAVLGAHDNARLWISGHAHNHAQTCNIFGQTTVGAREISFLSCPSLYFTQSLSRVHGNNPCWSCFLTFTAAGPWELRLREYMAGVWDSFGDDGRVVIVP